MIRTQTGGNKETRLSMLGNLGPALLGSRLGACWKCMALSSSLLAVSLAALLVGAERSPVPAFAAAAAVGFFMALSAAHVAMFLIRRIVGPRQGLSGRRERRGCCA